MNKFYRGFLKYLKHTGNLLHLDLNYFIKGSFYGILQQLVGVTCGLTVFYLFGHFVSRTVFGQYSLILSILGLLTFFSLPGIDTALITSVRKGFDKSFVAGMKHKFKYSLLGIPVLLIWSIFYLLQNNIVIFQILVVSAFIFPFLNTFTNFPSFLVAKKLFAKHALLASLSSIFYLFIFLILIFISPTSFWLIIGYFIALIIPYIFSTIYCLRFIKLKSQIDPNLRSYGLFLTGTSILPWIAGNSGSIILGSLLGAEYLAVFAIASRFIASAEKNLIVLFKPVSAKLAYQSPKEHLQTLKQHGTKLIILGIGISIIAWFATPYFIRFFSNQYQDAIPYGQYLSLILVPLPLHWVINDMLIYQKKKLAQILTSVIPDVTKIILYFILIPIWKINGLIAVAVFDRFFQPTIILLFILFENYRKK